MLVWCRLLAHAKVESVKSKEAAEQKRLKRRSWLSFRWFVGTLILLPFLGNKLFCPVFVSLVIIPNFLLICGFTEISACSLCLCVHGNLLLFPLYLRNAVAEDDSVVDASEGSQLTEERLTKEEWQAINNLLSHQPDDELTSHSGKDMQNMIQYLVTVSIGQAAARIININQTEIVCGRFEQLHVSTKFKHRSTHCDVLLRFYGLSAPEGSLAQVCFLILQGFDGRTVLSCKCNINVLDCDGILKNLSEFQNRFLFLNLTN